MRGEYCIAGASIATFISVVLLVFANIGQINSGTLVKNLYWIQVDVGAYGAGLQGATNTSVGGLYNTKNDRLGTSAGLRQYYRWGMYSGCAYQKDGSGICNSTSFGYEFEPLAQILSDTPAKFKIQTNQIIPDSSFKDDSWNGSLSRAAFWTIFIGSVLTAVALIVGVYPSRPTFLVSSLASILGALGLLIGAAMWTSMINKDKFLNIVHVQHGNSLGINISPGPALYLVWVAFAFTAVSTFPYVVSALTYRRF